MFLALLAAVSVSVGVMAQQAAVPAQELAGIWQGKLQVDPTTAMTIQFTFAKKPDGSYSATLNSPDNGSISNVAAEAVTFKGGALSLQVPSLSGSFAGTLSGGNINGQWKQPGGSLPLVLSPYQKPQLSKAAINILQGSWNGRLGVPQPDLTFLIELKPDGTGLTGSLTFAEQPVKVAPYSDIQFTDNKLVMNIQMPAGIPGQYTVTYANGTLTGVWRAGNPLGPPAGVPLVLKKGVYVAQVHVLKLSAEAFGLLAGAWKGDLHPAGSSGPTLPVVLRFETNKNADMVAFMDSPSQGAVGIAVTDATFASGKVVIKVGSAAGEYDATVTGNSMNGEWKQGPNALPLTLTRK
jgi:hypothetical protein